MERQWVRSASSASGTTAAIGAPRPCQPKDTGCGPEARHGLTRSPERRVDKVTVRMVCIDPRVDPLWLRLVQGVPSVVFHSPEWLQVLGDTYQLPIQAHVLVDE